MALPLPNVVAKKACASSERTHSAKSKVACGCGAFFAKNNPSGLTIFGAKTLKPNGAPLSRTAAEVSPLMAIPMGYSPERHDLGR